MKILVVTAIYPTEENPAFGSFVRAQVEALERAGINVEVLVLKGLNRKLMYAKGVFQLRQRLQDRSIGLVHAHYGYVGVMTRTQWKVPVVMTYHGDDVLGTVDGSGRTTAYSKVMAAICRANGRLADAVIVQTEQMAERFHPSANVHVVPHEVDLERFGPVDRDRARELLGLDRNKKYLLFAANPEIPVKRFPLAQAAAELLRRHDPEVELLVVYKETQPRLALYMSACDALVFPSYQEGSPNIVKQAMACNLPIAATDVGDVREIIGNTEGCHVCAPTAEDFAQRLREILLRRQRTCGCKQVQHLSSPNVARRLIHIYEDILRRPEWVVQDESRRIA